MIREYKLFTRTPLLLLAACFAGALPAAAAEPAGMAPVAEREPLELTLQSSIERIKVENPAVLFSRESVRRALQQSYQARAGLLPQVGVAVSQQRQKGRFLPVTDAQTFNRYQASIDATVPLLDAEQYARYKVAQLGLMVEERNFDSAVQEILEQMITVYFTHLRNLRLVELRREDLDADQALFDRAMDQFDAGLATHLDVERAQQQLSATKRRLSSAKSLVSASEFELKAVLDIDPARVIELIDGTSIFTGETGIDVTLNMARYTAMRPSVTNRPELKAQRKVIEQAEMERRRAGSQRLPRVDAFGSYGQDSAVIFDGDEQENWLAGVAVSLPVFEGFRISAEEREADALIRQTEYRMRDLENQFKREFETALRQVEQGFEEIGFAFDARNAAVEEVRLETERFDAGLTDNADLTLARQRQTAAEDALLDAIYRYGVNRVRLARSIGSVERVQE